MSLTGRAAQAGQPRPDQVTILVGGDLEELRVAALRSARAPIDAFCAGTALGTASDAPSLDLACTLVEHEGRLCSKRSPGKAIRRHAAMQLDALPTGLRSLDAVQPVSVSLSPGLTQAAPGIRLNPKADAAADQPWNPSRPLPARGDRRSPARPRPGAQTR
jgi:hypothetical protein